MMGEQVILKSQSDMAMLRKAGALAADVLRMIGEHVRPGVTTNQLDRICHDYIVDVLGAVAINIGYNGYPKTVCTSVNHVICHGIPSDKPLKNGDIVNIDVALTKDGWHGDTSRMYFVGQPSILAKRLVDTTYEAMRAGILAVKPWAISVMRFNQWRTRKVLASCRSIAAMASARSITRICRCCITVSRAKV